MQKYQTKLQTLEAEQWFPGKEVEGVITNPDNIPNEHWNTKQTVSQSVVDGVAQLGAFRVSGDYYAIVKPGSYIGTTPDGRKEAFPKEFFEESFELAPEAATAPEPTENTANKAPDPHY